MNRLSKERDPQDYYQTLYLGKRGFEFCPQTGKRIVTYASETVEYRDKEGKVISTKNRSYPNKPYFDEKLNLYFFNKQARDQYISDQVKYRKVA